MDDALIQRAQTGDAAAFRQLVERYAAVAERTARVLLPDRTAAEDAVQEAWLDAWRGLPRFQPGRPFRPWLLTLVANRCRKAARRRQPGGVALDETLADGLAGDESLTTLVLRLETDAELRAALARLPDDQQRTLELRFFADLELAEIATITGAPVGTVKSRLHRALRGLRAALERATPADCRTEVQP